MISALPVALSFSGNSLSGTPTQVGSFPVRITVTDLTECMAGTKNYTFVISGTPLSLITATAGNTQTATAYSAFPIALQVVVKDSGNNPLSDVNVTSAAPSSGSGGTFSGGVATATVVTNASGIAADPFAANSSAGSLPASVLGLTPINSNLTNTSFIVIHSPDRQFA